MLASRALACSYSSRIETGRAFAHHESIAILVEWTTGHRWMGAAHGPDKGERSIGQRTQWSFGGASDHDVRPIIADISERFPNRNIAAGATIGVGGSDSAESELNRRVTMCRPAEDLQSERLSDGLWSAMDKGFVLALRIGDAAERGSETDSHAIMRNVGRIVQAAVFEREFDRRHGELCVAVQSFQSMRGKNSLPETNSKSRRRWSP